MSTEQKLTITDLAERYRKNPSTIRAALKKLVGKPAFKREVQKGGGPKGDRYGRKIVEAALGKPPDQLPGGVDDVLFRRVGFQGVMRLERRARADGGDGLGVVAILASRKTAQDAYQQLVLRAVRNGMGLRIRALSGRDFFDKHRTPIYDAFVERAQRIEKGELDPGKIILLFPRGHGAMVRSKAEGDAELNLSQFSLDAASTIGFMEGHAERLKLKPRWVEDVPQSLLIWAEDFALLETYDHGSESEDRSGCIGRKAPILVIRGGSDYHRILRSGFDYIFDHEDGETTGVVTHGLDDAMEGVGRKVSGD